MENNLALGIQIPGIGLTDGAAMNFEIARVRVHRRLNTCLD